MSLDARSIGCSLLVLWGMAAFLIIASRHDRAYADSIRGASRTVRRLLVPLFEQAATDGNTRIDAEFAARSLYALEDGLYNSLATGKDDLKLGDARKACAKLIDDSFVDGR